MLQLPVKTMPKGKQREVFIMNFVLDGWALEGKNQSGDILEWRDKKWKIIHRQQEPAGERFILEEPC